MDLRYLDFDFSEDTEGHGTFEAMASVTPAQVPSVHAEIAMVLAWAFDHSPEGHGPLSEGFTWDHDLQSQQDWSVHEFIEFDAALRQVVSRPDLPGLPRHTLTLSVSGDEGFCQAFRHRFLPDQSA